jgi:uncharacterized protein (TIGR00251 family)
MLFIPPLDMLPLKVADQGVYLFVKVSPGTSKSAFGKVEIIQKKNYLKVYVKAAAVDGQANEALIEFIGKKLVIKKSSIWITSGITQRIKTLFIDGAQIEYVASKIYA